MEGKISYLTPEQVRKFTEDLDEHPERMDELMSALAKAGIPDTPAKRQRVRETLPKYLAQLDVDEEE